MMEDYQDIYVAHIYREGNTMVDDLAKASHGAMRLLEWDDANILPS